MSSFSLKILERTAYINLYDNITTQTLSLFAYQSSTTLKPFLVVSISQISITFQSKTLDRKKSLHTSHLNTLYILNAMSLINDHGNESIYISNPNSSEDLSSPETCGLDGGASASSSSTTNSDHQQNQGFVFYPSGETIEDHSSLMDFNASSFFSFDNHRSFITPTNNGSAFSVLDGNMSYGYTGWSHQMDSVSPRVIKSPTYFETTSSFGLTSNSASKPATNHGNGDWLYSDSTIVNTGSKHECASPKPAGNKRPSTVTITNTKDL